MVFLKECIAFWTFTSFIIEVSVFLHNLGSMNPIQGLLLKLQLTNLPVNAEAPGTRASIVYFLFLGLPPDTSFLF